MNVPITIGNKKVLFQVPVLRRVMIRRFLDGVCDPFIALTDQLAGNRRMQRLFLQIIHCARADAYDLYVAILDGNIAAARGVECPLPLELAALTKRIALHHAILFWMDNGAEYPQVDVLAAARTVFSLDETEEKELLYSMEIGADCPSLFHAEYAQAFAARLVRDDQNSPVVLAFASQFFYRSYAGFAKSFSNYLPFGGGFVGEPFHRRTTVGN